MRFFYIFLTLIIMITSSCSLKTSGGDFSKRKYMPRFKQGAELVDVRVNMRENSSKDGIASVSQKEITKASKTIIIETEPVVIKSSEKVSVVEEGCDELIKKDGSIIQAKISEIGISEIKYKKCGSEDGPIYVVAKSDIFMVKYANGETEVISTTEQKREENNDEEYVNFDLVDESSSQPPVKKKGEPNALISFILSCLAFVIAMIADAGVGFVIAIPALILSIIGLSRQSKYKERYKRPGFALPAIIISGVTMVIALAVIALLY